MSKAALHFTLLLFLLAQTCWADPQQLRLRISAGPPDLDWGIAGSQISSFVFANIMDGLTELDSKLVARPALAKSIEVSPDGKTYTFPLRTDVKWSDGRPLSADDFIAAWQRLLDPLEVKPFAVLLHNVVGAADYSSGKLKDFSQVGIKVVQPLAIQVQLINPQSFFPALLTSPVLFPMRRDLLAKYGRAWNEPGKIVVLGSYLPMTYTKGKELLLKRNDSYYKGPSAIESVLVKIISEDSVAKELFLRAELDVVVPINYKDAESLKGTPAFHTATQFRTRFLNFNCDRYPFNLPNVRKALASSIDRSKFTYTLKQGYPAADTLVPAELFPEGADIKVPFDLKAAKQALDDAGVSAEAFTLEIAGLSSDENALALNEVAEQIRKNLGMKVEVRLLSRESFILQVNLRGGPLFYLARGADFPNVESYLASFVSDSGLNNMKWKNAKFDELVKKASALPQGAERTAANHDALALLMTKAYAVIPLHFENVSYLVASRVKDFVISPLATIRLRDVHFNQ